MSLGTAVELALLAGCVSAVPLRDELCDGDRGEHRVLDHAFDLRSVRLLQGTHHFGAQRDRLLPDPQIAEPKSHRARISTGPATERHHISSLIIILAPVKSAHLRRIPMRVILNGLSCPRTL